MLQSAIKLITRKKKMSASVWWFLPAVVILIMLFASTRVKGPAVLKLKERAEQQFQSAELHGQEAPYEILAREAEIVMENETFRNPRSNGPAEYILKRFLRNAHGEYFMFIGGEAKPYLKHVEKRLAKIELGKHYRD